MDFGQGSSGLFSEDAFSWFVCSLLVDREIGSAVACPFDWLAFSVTEAGLELEVPRYCPGRFGH